MRAYVFLLILEITPATAAFWDCRNPQLNCASPGTCGDTGTCTGCTDMGHDCKSDNNNRNAGECTTDLCKNGGMCYDATIEDGAAKCYCPPEYMGDTCESKR
ncbi:EGF-like domain-containing protein 1 [Gigantopelta aegis]|uniref:EGF-like domain-containing protein 1 n=1 Tax=Gigantopelta aegis TaxID=1735272 RepID=UPI001B88A3B1|nr:EGF-like domain-containing protein 1 [Gigantopelta aegis]